MTIEIPSAANQALIVSKYELLMYRRSKKILGIIGITIAISALFIGLFEYVASQGTLPIEFDISMPIGFVFFLTVIIAAFFGSNSIVSEFNKKTGQMLFSNPVSKASIWFGKFLAAEIIAFSIISLYYAIMIAYAAISYEVPAQIGISLLFSFVTVTMVMSVAFLISTALRGQTGAAVLVFALFIIIFPMVDSYATLIHEKPWFTPTFASGIIGHSLTVPYPTDSESVIGLSFLTDSFIPKIADSLGLMIIYTIGASISSLLIFKKREIK